MSLISKQQIVDLHKVNQDHCVSIFIPTHRAGKKVLQQEDALALKNELKAVKSELSNHGMQNDVITKMMSPVQQLIEDSSFWREQSDGLALFIADGFFEKYTLPVHFKEFHYISKAFYLKPILPLFVDDGEFYLMTVEVGDIKLLDCTQHSFTPINIEDLIPENKQDRVGYDYEEKNLQFRTGQAGIGQVMYHGQEAATGKRKNEVKKYLRAVNDGLVTVFKDSAKPLLIASQDYLFDIYNGINTYPNLINENIKINLAEASLYDIHEMGWEHMQPVFDQKRKDKMKLFIDEEGTGKTAIEIGEILNGAINGKIDTLFCENDSDILGQYKEENGTLVVTKVDDNDSNISILNVAAIRAFLNGADVYLLDKEEMPNKNSKVNALFRY